jgi:hypothetical protein
MLAPLVDQPFLGNQNQLALPAQIPQFHRNDLTAIEGIDPVIEMALNSIGIRKFADFRGYTAETLAQALRERTGIEITAATIAGQDWTGWAELLETEAAKEETVEESSASAALHDEKSHELQAEAAATIHPEKQKPETQNEANGEVDLSIQQVRFHQFESPATANTAAAKFLRSEIDCRLTGATVPDMKSDRVALCAQIHALDTATGEHKMLASQAERLQLTESDCHFSIEFEAPKIGRYELQIVTFLLAANPKIAFYQGPILRVVT